MKKRTEREAIKEEIKRSLVVFVSDRKRDRQIRENVLGLDPETCTVKELDRALLDRLWNRCYCEECGKDAKEVIIFGEDDPYAERDPRRYVCKDCLRKALEL